MDNDDTWTPTKSRTICEVGIIHPRAATRYFWRGYWFGIATGVGLCCVLLWFSCTPVNKHEPYSDDMYTPWTLPDDTSIDTPIIDTTGTEWRIILVGIRDDTVRPGYLHDGWHGYVNGKPVMWAFASPGNHTLCFQMMTGADPIEVPCTIELRYTGGMP